MDVLWQALGEYRDAFVTWLPQLALAFLVMFLAWGAGRLAGRAVRQTLVRTSRGRGGPLGFFERLARAVVLVVGAGVALDIVGLGSLASGLLAGGGFTAVVLGFAFREIGENLLAGVLLAFSRPFDLGDWIQSGDHAGAVRGITMRTTHIRTIDGRDVFLPNAQIVTQPLENYTLDGLRRPSFTVGVDYATDMTDAVGRALRAVAEVPGVLSSPAPEVTLQALAGAWVTLDVSFWVDTERDGTSVVQAASLAMDAVRRVLLDAGVTLSSDTASTVKLDPASRLTTTPDA